MISHSGPLTLDKGVLPSNRLCCSCDCVARCSDSLCQGIFTGVGLHLWKSAWIAEHGGASMRICERVNCLFMWCDIVVSKPLRLGTGAVVLTWHMARSNTPCCRHQTWLIVPRFP